MSLSEQNISVDIDGNCFFRFISKELFGEQKHHECFCTIIVEYSKLNSAKFEQGTCHVDLVLQQDAKISSVCYSS